VSRRPRLLRPLALALLLVAGPAVAQPSARAIATLVVEPPVAAPEQAALAEAVAMWLRVELAAAGVPVAERGAATGGGDRLRGELRVAEGAVEVRLRLDDGASGKLIAGVRRRGPLIDLGELVRDAASRLLERVRLPSGRLRDALAPSLEELARTGRALAWLDAGELARARRELANRVSSLAAAVVAQIDAAADAPATPAAERARVRLAAGDAAASQALVAAEPGLDADARTLLAAAELAREQNNPRRERELLARGVALAPDDGEAALAYGRSLASVSPAEARPVLERAGRLLPDDPDPLEQLAALPDGAAHRAAAAERAAARFELARAQRLIETDAGSSPERAAEARRRVGDLQLGVGDAERARLAYEHAIELRPDDTEAWKGLARARGAAGDATGAEAAFREALARRPDDAETLRGLGELQLADGRPGHARPALERALALDPGDAAARVGLARALEATGESERAGEVLESGELDDPEALRGAAEVQRARGARAAAARALERAIELDPGDPELHASLAEVREGDGSQEAARESRERAFLLGGNGEVGALAAEPDAGARAEGEGFDGAAYLAQLVASFPSENAGSRLPITRVALLGLRPEAGWRAQLERWLAPRRLDLARIEADLGRALGARFERVAPDPDDPSLDLAPAWQPAPSRSDIARMNADLGTHAIVVARVIAAERDSDWQGVFAGRGLEVRMLLGADADVASLFANAQALARAEAAYEVWNPGALALYALLALAFAARVARGWGTLVVGIDYERLGPSLFTARLSRKPGRVRATADDRKGGRQRRFRQKIRELGRYQRTVVGRSARFRALPSREWHVAVHGLLEHSISREVIGRYFDEKRVHVARWKTTTVSFDFRANECSVEVSVTRAGAPVDRCAVAVEGVARSLRYTHAGCALVELGKGAHTILVGHQGRVVARRIRVEVLEPLSVAIELDDPDARVFDGCLEAVEPFLAGAREAAAAQLERAGQADVARRLRGEAAAARGDGAAAAELFEQSGRLAEAARAWLAQGRPERAAACFERLGQLAPAGEAWRAAGEAARAAHAYEQAGDYEAAIECYEAAGDRERLGELLERTEAWFEAAHVALERGDADRAIASLQKLSPGDPRYIDACRTLAEIFAERGETRLAIGQLDDAVAVAGAEHLAELQERRGVLLERAGRLPEALEAWEEVRRRDFHRAGAAERIDALRAAIAARERAEQATRVRTEAAPDRPQEERYAIQGELGRGGMGIVHRAHDRRLGRTIALKRLPESLREHPKVVELFLREARAAAQLNHPNIVTVHDVDQRDGAYFITMECLEGLPLHHLLRKHGRFPAGVVARLGLQVCAGLGFAHARGIVHRDIKTANLFMTRDKVVKIMDFGLAKSLAEVRRAGTVIGGTPNYMAPEQAVGDAVDAHADLYALGVTLFELATGTLPWTEGDVVYHHRHTPPPDPRERAADVPDALAELILQLMAKQPADRPSSAAEVAARLRAML
jgi:tetratricopeptide (TPR) repeat protein